MNCVREDLKAHITDVLVGEAETPLREQVLSHIESCASCHEDHDRVASVLGLLKEAPPWTAAGSAEEAPAADALSTIQRQRVESFAAARKAAMPESHSVKPGTSGTGSGSPMSWLAIAASVSAIALALALARQSSLTPIEAPTPPRTGVVNELPQALEGPMLPPPSIVATPDSVTTPVAERRQSPEMVPVAPEAMDEFRRNVEAERGKLAQAVEEAEAQPADPKPAQAKKDRTARDETGVPRGVEGGVAGGVAGGIVGGLPAEAPAANRPRGDAPAPSSSSPPARRSARDQEIDALRRELAQSPPVDASASAEEMKRELADADARIAKRNRLRELERDRDQSRAQPAPADMYFESKGTNPFIVTEEDPLATFGLDVDTASYTLARNYLSRGTLPPAAAVRVEEFVNAFPNNVIADRGSDDGSVFSVRADGAPNPLHPGYHVIRVAVKAKDVDPRERKPAHLTFVIDVSGSMAREDRLGLVKRSLALLVDKLDERDTIGVVVYGTTGRRLLAPTSVANRDRIMAVINALSPEGSTNLQDGLDLGYEMAVESFARDASNRVVLCTDGVANTGQVEADALLSRIRREAKRGIDMMALGFGMGNYNDALLQRLADEGNGQYAYIDDLGEARAFFLRKVTSVLEVVARDAKAQVEFNPARVERYRLLGYEKRDVADRDFRNDAVDAGEINSGHSVTALFEVKLRGGSGSGRIGTARLRYKTGPRSEGVEFSREIADEEMSRSFGQASPGFRTAYVAARFAEHLRNSYWVRDQSLAALQPFADELPETPQTTELAELIRKAARLIRPGAREDW
jgi:Ca-activated chloride channel family protein